MGAFRLTRSRWVGPRSKFEYPWRLSMLWKTLPFEAALVQPASRALYVAFPRFRCQRKCNYGSPSTAAGVKRSGKQWPYKRALDPRICPIVCKTTVKPLDTHGWRRLNILGGLFV